MTHPDDLTELLNQASKRIEARAALLEDLLYLFDGKRVEVVDIASNCSLTEYSAVYFRHWGQRQGHALAAARFCKFKGIPFVDSEVLRVGSQNKITQYMNLFEARVPIPKTLIGSPAQLAKQYVRYDFSFPLILKSIGGTRGSDNYLAHGAEEMQQIFTDNPDAFFVMQSFVPNDRDFRVIVMGDRVVGVIERKASSGSHLNNTSQGGTAAMVPVDSLPEEVRRLSVRAAQFFGRQIAGVDIVRSTADGKYYCFEVNRSPQIEHASFESEKAKLLAEYLVSLN